MKCEKVQEDQAARESEGLRIQEVAKPTPIPQEALLYCNQGQRRGLGGTTFPGPKSPWSLFMLHLCNAFHFPPLWCSSALQPLRVQGMENAVKSNSSDYLLTCLSWKHITRLRLSFTYWMSLNPSTKPTLEQGKTSQHCSRLLLSLPRCSQMQPPNKDIITSRLYLALNGECLIDNLHQQWIFGMHWQTTCP